MRYLFACCFLLFALSANAQTDSTVSETKPEPPPFPVSNPNAVKAFFPGGDEAMLEYLSKNIQYPARCKKKKLEGIVIITFVVEKNGELTNIVPTREVKNAPELTEEAIRVIRLMPNWSPGTLDGKPVRVSCNVPIRFALRN